MIEKIVADVLSIKQSTIKDEHNLVEALGADSLNIDELVIQIEELQSLLNNKEAEPPQ